jgi:hypothetical protein
MKAIFPSSLVQAYLAAVGQITSQLHIVGVKRSEKESAPPRRRASDRNPPLPLRQQ